MVTQHFSTQGRNSLWLSMVAWGLPTGPHMGLTFCSNGDSHGREGRMGSEGLWPSQAKPAALTSPPSFPGSAPFRSWVEEGPMPASRSCLSAFGTTCHGGGALLLLFGLFYLCSVAQASGSWPGQPWPSSSCHMILF